MKKLHVALVVTAAAAAFPAMAQFGTQPSPQPLWYIGGGVGRGNLNVSGTDLTGLANASVDDSATSYTGRIGFRFNPYMAIEGGYYDLGKYSFEGSTGVGNVPVSGTAKAKSFGISFVGILPIDQWDLYGRIGYAHSELKLNANAPLQTTSFNEKDTQDEATYGVGARWNIQRNWGLFAEWMKNDKIKVDSYLFGVDFRF